MTHEEIKTRLAQMLHEANSIHSSFSRMSQGRSEETWADIHPVQGLASAAILMVESVANQLDALNQLLNSWEEIKELADASSSNGESH